MTRITLAMLMLMSAAGSTTAEAETAQQMYVQCPRAANPTLLADGRILIPNDPASNTCWGAFAAVQELIRIADVKSGPLLKVCAPELSTRTQMISIFQKYVAEHPGEGHLGFGFIVLKALQTSFPCPGP